MPDKEATQVEGLSTMGLPREERGGVGRKTGPTEQEQEDLADLRIAEERLQAIREGRTKVISGAALDKALAKIFDV